MHMQELQAARIAAIVAVFPGDIYDGPPQTIDGREVPMTRFGNVGHVRWTVSRGGIATFDLYPKPPVEDRYAFDCMLRVRVSTIGGVGMTRHSNDAGVFPEVTWSQLSPIFRMVEAIADIVDARTNEEAAADAHR
jgi:hypothetical protein